MEASQVATGHYVYAFIRAADADAVLALSLQGLNDCMPHVERFGDLAIVISDMAVGKIRPRRPLLAAHQNVVSEIAKRFDMLPVAFGLVADDMDSVESMLSSNTDLLLEQLERVAGKVEMGLCLTWTIENIYQFFSDRNEDLRSAREELAAGTASHDLKVSVGRLFEQLLNAECEQHTQTVVQGLNEIDADIEIQSKRNEKDVVRLSCLIGRDEENAFAHVIHRIAEKFDDNFAFSFNGPWPPYSFVNVTVTTE